jgi:CheY-like chemotaxis protein
MLLSALRSFGCYAARATTGAEGLRYVRENEPDAVVGDWNLSDMTGPEFARRVKSARFETKVLLQKEGADARSLRKTLECGGEELLERSTPVSRLFRLLSAPVPA